MLINTGNISRKVLSKVLRSFVKNFERLHQELFFLLVRYFLIGQEETEPEIVKALEKKMDALVMRELYTQYKTAPTEEEKEKARREYLDKRGVPDSFRW